MKNASVPSLPIKKRSLSMPTISPAALQQPIHKIRRSKQGEFLIQKEVNDHLPVISLLGMKDKEEEELSSKIKIIAERNMKKIEGRYETVDRWKHKYFPDSSVLLIKLKEREGELIEDHRQTVLRQNQEAPPVRGHQQKHQKLLPVIARQPFIQTIPDHREQSRKLEEELVARLQKNKRYYNVKNTIEKQINYFQHPHQHSLFDKRREIQLKRTLVTSERNQKFSGMFHKKISLSQHFPDLKFIKDSLKKGEEHHRQITFKDNPQQQREFTFSRLIKRSKSIKEFKESLLEQAAEMVPEGWNNSHESDNDLQQ